MKVNCIHYYTCISGEPVCSDPYCPVNKLINKKEHEEHLQELRVLFKKLMEDKHDV